MPRLTSLLIIILLIFLFEISSGTPDGVIEGGSISPEDLISKIRHRKVLVETLDYDYGGPNTRHDPPRRGKPGSGGKNP